MSIWLKEFAIGSRGCHINQSLSMFEFVQFLGKNMFYMFTIFEGFFTHVLYYIYTECINTRPNTLVINGFLQINSYWEQMYVAL